MLILLPPSETKRPGGVGVSIDKACIIWAALDPTRDILISELGELCKAPDLAAKALKLGKKSQADIEANLALMTSGTMPALERYTGVVFDAIGYDSLSPQGLKRAEQQLFIQSALFGLLPAMEQIPYYRFSAGTKLAGINLASLWQDAHQAVWPRLSGPILDMRSKAYVALNPIPEGIASFYVDVVDSDQGRALNHFNKKAKGSFVRAALENGLDSIDDVPRIAKLAGLSAKIQSDSVQLAVPAGY